MRALLIEDDSVTTRMLEMALASEGIVCDSVKLGTQGLQISRMRNYDIIMLDLMLPDIDGYEVLMRLRSAKVRTPVVIISGLFGTSDKLKGFNTGADDYVTKPFNKDELIARINAIVRRCKGHAQSVVRFGGLAINLDTRLVEVNGTHVHLTSKEYAILELLAISKPHIVKKDHLLSHLYQLNEEPELKIIDVFVCKLRKKLKDASKGFDYIDTSWGRGYALRCNDEDLSILNKDDYVKDISTNSHLIDDNSDLSTEISDEDSSDNLFIEDDNFHDDDFSKKTHGNELNNGNSFENFDKNGINIDDYKENEIRLFGKNSKDTDKLTNKKKEPA